MTQDKARALAVERIRDSSKVIESLALSAEYLKAVTDAAEAMTKCLRAGNKILFFGNGGSAADAQHLAAELSGRFLKERRSLPGLALTTNTSALTAIGNDYSFDEVFSRQLEGIGVAGDLAFGISTSGNSANVLRAMDAARMKGLATVGLAGRTGGKLAKAAEICISIPSDQTPRIQEGHILTGHVLCELMEEALFGQ